MSALLAFGDKVVNEQAAALSPTIGWLLLGCALAAVAIFTAYGDRWRRWWMSSEDPRGIAAFRIVFSFFVIANINGMWEFFEFLYTDEGIFTADVARHVFARHQFVGFGDGLSPDDPAGFYGWAGLWEFLKGPKYSLLYFWDSPNAFWVHLVAFEVAAVCLMIGFRTRLMGVLTWFLMNSILQRNHLAWEGTELVFRCFLVYLVLARSGHAYSVDNWLRCRKLRKQGRLSERDGPGEGAGLAPSEEHPNGLAAIYRRIPSWPRKLMMLQLATIYITTGTLKTGSVWLNGDSLYYALNLDHFYRVPPQFLSSVAGTTVFRGMTWAVKIGQTGFSLILVGIITRWMIKEGFAPLTGLRKWAARIGFGSLIVLTGSVAMVAWPVHFTPPISAGTFFAIWVGLWAGIWLFWRKLEHNPWTVTRIGKRTLSKPAVIDRTWVCRWIIGRRVLLVWHLAFHAHIFTLMNVGQFQTAMLSAALLFLQGREIATLLRDVGHKLAKWGVPFIPKHVAERAPIIPEEDPSLPHLHHDRVQLPLWSVVVATTVVLVGIVAQVQLGKEVVDWRLSFLAALAFLAGLMARRWWRAKKEGSTEPSRHAWAYGPAMRLLVGATLVWHLAAVVTWLLPDKDCVRTFRGEARKGFAVWLRNSTTDQGWGMFAPNPPRSNVFMQVLVTDADGEVWDLRTDVYAEENMPIPWIWNTRLRKMNRRIIGGESGPSDWYRKWYARYQCRQWARDHGGEAPKKVELVKLWYKIPSPEQTRQQGYYDPKELLERTGHEKVMYTERCEHAVMGQLPNFIRERDGLPLLEPDTYRPWHKNKREKWETRHERAAKKKAREAEKKARKAKK